MTTHLLLPHISCRVFWWNIQSPRWLSPLQPRFVALRLLAFPQIKITFEREEISDCWWDSGKYDGAANGDWENCVRSQGVYFDGHWGVIVLCTMFLVSCIFFNKCLYFSYYLAGYLLERSRIHTEVLFETSLHGQKQYLKSSPSFCFQTSHQNMSVVLKLQTTLKGAQQSTNGGGGQWPLHPKN